MMGNESRTQEELMAEIGELRWQLKEANNIISAIHYGDARILPAENKEDKIYIQQDSDHVRVVVNVLIDQKWNDQRFMCEVFDQAAESMMICDVTGRIVRFNKAAARLFGPNLLYTWLDQTIPLCTAEDSKPFSLNNAIFGENIRSLDVMYTNPDGETYTLTATIVCLVGPETKEVHGFSITFWDITVRRQHEEQLKKLNLELVNKLAGLHEINEALRSEINGLKTTEEILLESRNELVANEQQLKQFAAELAATNTELKSFANIVAHDFRTPMVNLKGFSRELMNSLDELKQIIRDELVQLPESIQQKLYMVLEKDVPDSLEFIRSSVDRLDRMVTALLKLARLGRREMTYQKVDMNKLVTNVLQSFNHQITKMNIILAIGPLPEIESDHLAMEQIFSNLLDNAIKYLKPGCQGKIKISSTSDGEKYSFIIEDNGCGIIAADQERIFDIFWRAGKQELPGDGMGLAYVRTLVRQLGGNVWCESECGTGTKINFYVKKPQNK